MEVSFFYCIFAPIKPINKRDMEIMAPKDKRKFDIALINSCVVYWYLGDDETFISRIESYEEWLPKYPSRKKEYNALLNVKKFIQKYDLTNDFLKEYCYNLEHNNPRNSWQKKYY